MGDFNVEEVYRENERMLVIVMIGEIRRNADEVPDRLKSTFR
jgi:hypothetical protein